MTARSLALGPLLLIVSACSTNSASTEKQQASQAASSETSLEEDFSYPGAEAILATQKIRLLEGDGNLLLVRCDAQPGLIRAFGYDQPDAEVPYCFSVRGAGGHLKLEMTRFYLLDNVDTNKAVSVTVNQAGSVLTRTVNPHDMGFFGVTDENGKGHAALVELRAFTP